LNKNPGKGGRTKKYREHPSTHRVLKRAREKEGSAPKEERSGRREGVSALEGEWRSGRDREARRKSSSAPGSI